MSKAEFPRKLAFLRQRHPYKILYGGRDGCKSWGIAQQLILDGAERPIRWLCARETQKSMKDSVHKLLSDTISRLELDSEYTIKQESIVGNALIDTPQGPRRTEFLFAGIKDAKNIKSYESCDGCWIEEAQNVSKTSWEIILPTIRKEGSEIWVSFNPELATDETYIRWVLNPPPGAQVVKIGYEDNPWLSDVSRARIEHLRSTDPKAFAHIYGGECVSEIEGAIFAAELKQMEAEGRIGQVPYDRTKPVHTAWDLGFGDPTAIWFVQAASGYLNFIDFLSANEQTIADYVIMLQNRGYMYGVDVLPHDAVDNIIHRKLMGVGDQSQTIPNLMRTAGRNVQLSPKLLKTDSLNLARSVFPVCRIDAQKCADGLQSLRHYAWDRTPDENGKRKPLHDKHSHPADAFITACVSIKRGEHAPPPQKRAHAQRVVDI